MSVEVVTVPCRTDNYAFLLHDSDERPHRTRRRTRGGAHPRRLERTRLEPRPDLDHAPPRRPRGGRRRTAVTDARVIGAEADRHRLPALDEAVARDQSVRFRRPRSAGDRRARGTRWATLPSTSPMRDAVFTADSLMALGCGRLFEGTAGQMWQSLSKPRRPAGRHSGLFGPRIHRQRTRASPVPLTRTIQRLSPASKMSTPPRRRTPHRPVVPRTREGHEPVPPGGISRGEGDHRHA